MENVIKQGYLKKGNSTEGGVLSGIREKMASRKWYILVVRRRHPFLEQYERDVDIFSGLPGASYDLSKCTHISRTMATTARTFNFVIVCPDTLIELIAATREQMKDWCDTLERTLDSLGILKRDLEEHVYSFCPAVSNLVGRSQSKAQGDEDDEDGDEEENDYADEGLGAVGGAPPPLPPPPAVTRSQQPPPLPGGHPSLMRIASKEPPRETGNCQNNSPPPPFTAPPPPPPLRKSDSIEKASSPKLPPLPPTPTQRGASIPSYSAPPLPPGRAGPSPTPPPPLPAPLSPPVAGPATKAAPASPCLPERSAVLGLKQQEKSLPPRPVPSLKPEKSKNHDAGVSLNKSAEDSDSSDPDDSSDFVSGAFWEINRKIPVPTARHATLDNRNSDNGDALNFVDEGYTDLASVSHLRDPNKSQPAESNEDKYSVVHKKPVQDCETVLKKGVDKTGEGCDELSVNGLNLSAASQPSDKIENVGVSAVTSNGAGEEDLNIAPGQASRLSPNSLGENFYAPFPGRFEENNNLFVTDNGVMEPCNDVTEAKSADVTNPNQELHLDLDTDSVYASAAEASSLPAHSVPPLPKRLDSLPTWQGDTPEEMSANGKADAASNRPVLSGASPAEVPVTRPVPARRKLIGPTVSSINPTQDSSPSIPPLPPRRSTVINRGVSLDSCYKPPPLPARKVQSFYSKRPSSDGDVDGDEMGDSVGAEGCRVEPEGASSRPPNSVLRQGSFGGSDVSENHLRQRMRLDREHSVNSVVSLKRNQAEILKQEMELPGVTVTVTPRAALGIAFVDCANAVCVVGWNQKDFPSLHGKFHIGDQLISICNIKITSAAMAQKMLKHPQSDTVEMLVKRIPFAQVLAIRREAEGQNIGIKRNGGTAEIQYVDPNGLAAGNGLPQYASAVLESGRTTWTLTEINSRHLSLFFKDSEIEHRLNAVGREISFVVQPSDYISELKKLLKKMKNYKNYIVQ